MGMTPEGTAQGSPTGMRRSPVPDIHLKLRGIHEPRKPLASTLVVTAGGQSLVLTLAPLRTARLMGQGPRALSETRVYAFDLNTRLGLGSRPRYAVFSDREDDALARHASLVVRLEGGTFEAETARDVLEPICPLVQRATERFQVGDLEAARAALEEALRVAGRMDAVHHFLHLYQEVFLMRGLAVEGDDPEAAKAAYREFIALYAGLPSPHPEVQRAVARAREAIERLTPVPSRGVPGTARRIYG